MEFFASCPAGFEPLLANELRTLGTPRVRPLQGQVAFESELGDAYRVCLWSRLASRVTLVLARFDAPDADALYQGVSQVAWEDHLPPHATFAVDATGTNAHLKSTQFTAMKAKDAVVDRLLARNGVRAQVDTRNPHIRLVVRISRDHASIGLDLAGEPLFHRGYLRTGRGKKTTRADYAAALLQLCDKDTTLDGAASIAALATHPDTLLVEAALSQVHYAPGLSRVRWGFDSWLQHDAKAWETLVSEARAAARHDVRPSLVALPLARDVSHTKSVLATLGFEVDVRTADPAKASLPQETLLVADLSDIDAQDLTAYAARMRLTSELCRQPSIREAAVMSRDSLLTRYLETQPTQTVRSKLGQNDLLFLRLSDLPQTDTRQVLELPSGARIPLLVPASDQFAARLRKVGRLRAKWARREDVSCYRVYDADLPDYAVSLELFQGVNPETGEITDRRWLQVFEYAPPKDIDPELAQSRLLDVLAIAPSLLNVDEKNVFVRVRRRAKGGSQYANETVQASGRTVRKGGIPLPPGAHLVDEGGLIFEVNFPHRLDCGIFLDHRDTRALLREMAKKTKGSKRFLNLFAYTGTATCYAADGGMKHTTTVDLSRPSLDWARRNMARNGFGGKEHEFVQADVVGWVREQRRTRNRWDLVFCDVPTFSNSSRMGKRSFDVQRDHAELLIGVSRLLTQNGVCVFSCNLRSFKPDVAALTKAGVELEDITAKTIPEDFARNPLIHHAYLVRRTPRQQ